MRPWKPASVYVTDDDSVCSGCGLPKTAHTLFGAEKKQKNLLENLSITEKFRSFIYSTYYSGNCRPLPYSVLLAIKPSVINSKWPVLPSQTIAI